MQASMRTGAFDADTMLDTAQLRFGLYGAGLCPPERPASVVPNPWAREVSIEMCPGLTSSPAVGRLSPFVRSGSGDTAASPEEADYPLQENDNVNVEMDRRGAVLSGSRDSRQRRHVDRGSSRVRSRRETQSRGDGPSGRRGSRSLPPVQEVQELHMHTEAGSTEFFHRVFRRRLHTPASGSGDTADRGPEDQQGTTPGHASEVLPSDNVGGSRTVGLRPGDDSPASSGDESPITVGDSQDPSGAALNVQGHFQHPEFSLVFLQSLDVDLCIVCAGLGSRPPQLPAWVGDNSSM